MARWCRLRPFVKLARSITEHRPAILDAIKHGLSNARVESVNTRIRLLTRIAFGFHSAQPLIAMVLLALGGLCPALPDRSRQPTETTGEPESSPIRESEEPEKKSRRLSLSTRVDAQ